MGDVEKIKQNLLELVDLAGVQSEEGDIFNEDRGAISYEAKLMLWREETPQLDDYFYGESPETILIDSLRSDMAGKTAVEMTERIKNTTIHGLQRKLSEKTGYYVGRNYVLSGAGPDGGLLVMGRKRLRVEKLGGFIEVPGGKVNKEVRNGVTLQKCLREAGRELHEEAGELQPSNRTRVGVCVGLVSNGTESYLEVGHVSVVSNSTLMYLCQTANARTAEENIEEREGVVKGPWLPMIHPDLVAAEQFMPTTALCLRAITGVGNYGKVGEWSGVGIFIPYRIGIDDLDRAREMWKNGRRMDLWDLGINGIVKPEMSIRRKYR